VILIDGLIEDVSIINRPAMCHFLAVWWHEKEFKS
jgi:hypothetical protein